MMICKWRRSAKGKTLWNWCDMARGCKQKGVTGTDVATEARKYE